MRRRELICGTLALTAGGSRNGAALVVASGWESKLNALLPTPEEERWLSIPWKLSLSEAIGEATRSGRPIMAWVMNGNPLGCG